MAGVQVPSDLHGAPSSGNAKRALLVERLLTADGPVPPSPLSFAQQRLWFLHQLEPNRPLYNIAKVVHMKGELNVSALEQAFTTVVARHEALRTRFIAIDGSPTQVIDEPKPVEIRLVDLASRSAEERELEAERVTQAEINGPFDLGTGPLLRVTLLRMGPDAHRLLVLLHHLVADEWSLQILFGELATSYEALELGKPLRLPELPIQYADFAVWQRDWLSGAVLENQLSYWKKQLSNRPPVLELPLDHARARTPAFRGANLSRPLGKPLSAQLKDLAKNRQATLFMILLAAFKALLHRYTQQTDLVVASPIAGRNRVETEGLVGFFVNTLLLRTNLEGNLRFDELLERVREVTLGAYDHQDLPFEKLVEELHPKRSLTHLPFTRVMFVVQTNTLAERRLPRMTWQFRDLESDTAKFDVTLVFQDTSDGLVALVEYDRDLFDSATIGRLLEHFDILLRGIVADPAQRICDLPLLTDNERHQVVIEWNQTSTSYPRDRSLAELFEAQVELRPDATAVVSGRQSLTYRELNQRANQLAHYLRRRAVAPEQPVAICLDRSTHLIVALLATIKAGGFYVPLDPCFPRERLAFMLKDSRATELLTTQSLLSQLPRTQSRPLCLDTDWKTISRETSHNPTCVATPENLAYVMFTSGSTGEPKGVAVPHRAVNRLVLNTDYIRLDPTDRIAQVSNASFDAATFEIWGALLNGGQLVILSKEVMLSPQLLACELRQNGVTALFLTSALFNQLAAEVPGAFASFRTVIVGGEALDPKWVRNVLRHQPPLRLVNGYGPTENTTFTCCFEVRDLGEHATNVPIGRPIANTLAYILDPHLNPVPIGVPGELYAGGDGLARGYWNRPKLTAERFIASPFAQATSPPGAPTRSRLYKTGDLARFLPDGTIEFLGRTDNQVKIRGFRVELGEIEAVLGRCPGIREIVVVLLDAGSGDKKLVAYFVPSAQPAPNASQLHEFAGQRLPDFMVPAQFIELKTLPLNPNGKVDRKALPVPDRFRPALAKRYAAPRDLLEKQLVHVWEQVLGFHPVGIEDKFFDLGGHSLLAVRVIAQIEKICGKKLRLATIFQTPTIKQLAARLREDLPDENRVAGTSLVEIQTHGSRPPLFLVHGAGGGMFWGYVNLSRHLGPDQPIYGFRSHGLDGEPEFDHLEDMAAQYITDLRAVQPSGPYYLGGYCFGGNVAYEMARQLAADGHQVAFLALLNCSPPNSSYARIPWSPRWALKFLGNLLYWGKYFGQWSASQRVEFFRWKWSLLKKRVDALRTSSRPWSRVDAADLVDLSAFTEEERDLWQSHIRALLNLHHQPYPGLVHLFRSPGHPLWCSFDEDYGWGELAMGGVRLTVVPGAHEQILEEPCVQVLARELAHALSRSVGTANCQFIVLPTGSQQESQMISDTSQNTEQATPIPMSHSPNPVPTPDLASQTDYWKQRLQSAPPLIALPADRPHLEQSTGAITRLPLALPPSVATALESLSQQQGGALEDTLLAAFFTLLYRYTGLTDLVLGYLVPATQRTDGATQFITNSQLLRERSLTTALTERAAPNTSAARYKNVVPLRCDLSGDPSFAFLLTRVREVLRGALAHADVPLYELMQQMQPGARSARTPLVQVLFLWELDSQGENPSEGVPSILSGIDSHATHFDLALRLANTPAGLSGYIDYDSTLFDEKRIARLIQHFTVLLQAAAAQPDQSISVLPLLPEQEITQLLEWNATQRDYPNDQSLIDLFTTQVARTPQAEALVCGTQRLTYAALDARSREIASHLQGHGVENEALVGICLRRSSDMVAAILGTLFAGGAYVPLDPSYPRERIAFIMQDAGLNVLLTQNSLLGLAPGSGVQVLCLENLGSQALLSAFRPPRSHHLAYVLYTSGSTGKPKGVAVEHRSAVALINWAKETFQNDLAGVLAATSICFDLSIFELFSPLSSGGKIILADNALALPTLPAAAEVSLINTVPSAIRELLRIKGLPPSVGVINLAGEPLSAALVDQIYSETSVRKVYDLYGPTETTTYSTGTLRQRGAPATIGKPLPNEQIYLLDDHLQMVPIGISGGIYIGGHGLARGYLHRPDLTAERFIPHPFKAAERLYRTGDLARWREDGNLEFLGRRDYQVKIRGFRIELGEVESVLKQVAAVRDAVVLAREDQPGNKRLVAYVVLREPGHERREELRNAVQKELPDYMMPSAFVFLDALPLTPNGKVDRKALPPPAPDQQASEQTFIAPRSSVEQQLAAIWQEVLGLKQVGIADNFFALGGHSLLAIQIVARMREVLQVELPLTALFTHPTIEALSTAFAASQWTQGQTPVLPLQPVPRQGHEPVSFVQERLWFIDQLEPGTHAYNVPAALRLNGILDIGALERALHAIVGRHEALRCSFRYVNDNLGQVVSPEVKLEVRTKDFQTIPASEREARAHQWINAQAQQSFDLERGPLIRASLARLQEREHIFLVVMHHTVSDGWSLALLFHELELLYNNQAQDKPAPPLAELPVQYVDFAHWQRQWMQGPLLERELAYWKAKLDGAPASLDLPADKPEPDTPSRKASRRTMPVNPAVLQSMLDLGKREGSTQFIVLMAALVVTLHKWTRQKDLVIGTVVAGRNRREVENVMGCFMNFLPIRAILQGNETSRDLLAAVKAAVLEGQSHQDCPFEKIVEAVNPERRLNENPLYNVALLSQHFPEEWFRSDSLKATPVAVDLEAALLDLRFEIETRESGLALSCEFKTDRFEAKTIDQLLASCLQVLEKLVRQPEARISDLALTRGLQDQATLARSRNQRHTIAITATFTAEPVAEPLNFWMKELGISASVEFASYNQVFQQLLDPASVLGANPSGLNVVLLRLEDWDSSAPKAAATPSQNLERTANEFTVALKAAAHRSATPFLICFCPPSASVATDPERAKEFQAIETRLRAELEGFSGVYLLSNAELARWYPVAEYDDPTANDLGHVPYTPLFFTALATAVARKFHALLRPPHKVIVLDCDQTLWAGVCGEDGPNGIRLDPPYHALQSFMRAQQEAGTLLCLCSKNNQADVAEVFAQRLDMPLRYEHFAASRLNWLPKSQNLKSLAQELRLGLDSFILVDDNPVECAEVEANCPEVLTLQVPEDLSLIPRFLEHCWVFDHLKLTVEDRRRGAFYLQNQQREKLREQSPGLADFLAGLELKISIAPVAPDQLPRAAQLLQRTNQFNCTTRRYAEAELQHLLSQAEVLVVEVSDRFGDYGLVGLMILTGGQRSLDVDSFLLSCRVLGRGVEHRMLAHLGALARERRAQWLALHFVPTPRNKPALDFLENVGAAFKQPLNGGHLFRFPAGFAAQVVFHPPAAQPASALNSPGKPAQPGAGNPAFRKFTGCRALALDANEVSKIHEKVTAKKTRRAAQPSSYVVPKTALERQLCELWQNVLRVERVGTADNFFQLGGHSLLAVRLFAEIERQVGRKLPLVTLFQAPTVAELARVLRQDASASSDSLLVPIQPYGTKPPLFLVHGAGGDVLWGYANLAAHLPPDQTLYGIKSGGQAGLEESATLEDMAACYLQEVRSFQPSGPYFLGGYCFGGNVAYEMARQLVAEGQQVALLALLDSAPSNVGYETVTWWRPSFAWRFARNLSFWLGDFLALESSQRRRFVSRKLRALGRKIQDLLHAGDRRASVDLEEVIDPAQFPEHELKLWRAHLEALLKHVEKPYSGTVTLLRTRGQPVFCSLVDDFCWGKLAQGGVILNHIPGSHENIFNEPNVKALARELSASLADSQAQSKSPVRPVRQPAPLSHDTAAHDLTSKLPSPRP